jgi:hypothetical protein
VSKKTGEVRAEHPREKWRPVRGRHRSALHLHFDDSAPVRRETCGSNLGVVADCNNSARCSTCACQHPLSTGQIVQSCLFGLPFFQKTPCSITDRIRPGGRRLPTSPRGRPESAWPFAHWANAVFFGSLALSKAAELGPRKPTRHSVYRTLPLLTRPGSYGLRVRDRLAAVQVPRVAAFGQSRPTRAWRPSGVTATALTLPYWFLKVRSVSPVPKSQSRNLPGTNRNADANLT